MASSTNPADPAHVALQDRTIDDLERLAGEYFSRIEGALTYPYDSENAALDYEALMSAISRLEKTFEACGALHLNSCDKGKDANSVIQDALKAKSTADAQYQKMSLAASLAKTRFSSAAAGEWWEE